MLAASSRLCGCSLVLKAKAKKLPAEIDALHELMDYTGREVATAWTEELEPAIGKIRSIGTTAKAKAELRRVRSIANAFGRKKGVEELFEELIRLSYALGRLYIRGRDAQIRATGKLPPPPELGIRKAKKSPAATIVASFDFELADEKALEQLGANQTLWLRDNLGSVVTPVAVQDKIVESATKLVESGAAAAAIGQKLRSEMESAFGVGMWEGKSLGYWQGVVDYAATSAAVAGQFAEMQAIGWTRYEIVNPMDERTTPICQMMNGKTALVEDAVALQAKMDAIPGTVGTGGAAIDAMKEIKPFASGGKSSAITSEVGGIKASGAQDLTPAQSKDLAAAGFAFPPFHFRCRSFVDIAFDVGDPVPMPDIPGVTPKPKPAPAPAPKPPAPAPKPKPPAPAPKPKAPVIAPDELLPPAFELPEGGFPFFLEECKVVKMDLGGSVPKFAIKAPDGSIWMFKDYSVIDSAFLADVEATASLAAKAAGVRHSETYKLALPKEWVGWGAGERPRNVVGGVQKLFDKSEIVSDGIGKGVKGAGIETFAAQGVVDIQTDHVLNWLISNGDAHFDNFIELAGGRIAGIDKGQGFKFFGKDRLAFDYVSQQVPLPNTNGFAYAESQFVRYTRGQMGKDFELIGVFDEAGELTELGKRIKAIVDIPDADYAASIRPYVEEMKRRGWGLMSSSSPYNTVEEGVEAIVARKRNLLRDFDTFYKDVESRRRQALGLPEFGAPPPPPPQQVEAGVVGAFKRRQLFRNFAEICEQTAENRMTGFTSFVGGADFEDLILRGMKHNTAYDGKSRFSFRGRLRPDASARVKKKLDDILGVVPSSSAPKTTVPTLETYALKTKAERATLARQRIDEMWNGQLGEPGVFRFVKSFNIRFDPTLNHSMFGDPLGKYEGVYDDLLAKFTKLAAPGTSKAKRIALSKELGYEVTSAEVKAAKHYRDLLRAYKKADGSWNADNVSSVIGQTPQLAAPKTIRVLDSSELLPPTTPAAPATVPKPGKFEPIVEQLTHVDKDGAALSVYGNSNKLAYATEAIDLPGGMPTVAVDYLDKTSTALAKALKAKHSYKTLEPKVHGYVVRHPTQKDVVIRFLPHDNSLRDFQGDVQLVFRGIKRGAVPSKAQAEAMEELLDHLGIAQSKGGVELDEMKMIWARKQARAMGLDLDPSTKGLFENIPDSLPFDEQVRRLEKAFDAAAQKTGSTWMKWGKITDGMTDEDFYPIFSEKRRPGWASAAGPDRSFEAKGHPLWLRRDITEEGLKAAGIRGAYSAITGVNLDELLDIMLKGDNLALNSTGYRVRNGVPWWGSMSPVDDMRTGGSNYVFTRINIGNTHSYNGNKYSWDWEALEGRIKAGTFDPSKDSLDGVGRGVYFRRKALLSSDSLHYESDLYGEVSSDSFIHSNMVKTMRAKTPEEEIARVMKNDGTNEMIVKGTLGIDENAAFWIVESHPQRSAMIRAAKANGVDELGGKPVEEFFVVAATGAPRRY